MFKMGCSMARKILAIDGKGSSASSSSSPPGDNNPSSSKKSKDKHHSKENEPATSSNNTSNKANKTSGDELNDFSKLEEDPRIPLNVRQIFKITKSWKAIARTMSKTGTAMFLNLFEQNEDLFYLFDRFQHLKGKELHDSMELREHAATVMSTLDQSINSLSDYDNFVTYLHSIGKLHRKIPGFKREHFWKIEQPFLKAVKQTLDERCNETIEEIYKIAIKLIIETIAVGYGEDDNSAPNKSPNNRPPSSQNPNQQNDNNNNNGEGFAGSNSNKQDGGRANTNSSANLDSKSSGRKVTTTKGANDNDCTRYNNNNNSDVENNNNNKENIIIKANFEINNNNRGNNTKNTENSSHATGLKSIALLLGAHNFENNNKTEPPSLKSGEHSFKTMNPPITSERLLKEALTALSELLKLAMKELQQRKEPETISSSPQSKSSFPTICFGCNEKKKNNNNKLSLLTQEELEDESNYKCFNKYRQLEALSHQKEENKKIEENLITFPRRKIEQINKNKNISKCPFNGPLSSKQYYCIAAKRQEDANLICLNNDNLISSSNINKRDRQQQQQQANNNKADVDSSLKNVVDNHENKLLVINEKKASFREHKHYYYPNTGNVYDRVGLFEENHPQANNNSMNNNAEETSQTKQTSKDGGSNSSIKYACQRINGGDFIVGINIDKRGSFELNKNEKKNNHHNRNNERVDFNNNNNQNETLFRQEDKLTEGGHSNVEELYKIACDEYLNELLSLECKENEENLTDSQSRHLTWQNLANNQLNNEEKIS